jgi:oxaloacetate decarboxylase alpha subunit
VLDRIMALPRTLEIQQEPTKMTLKDRRKLFPASMSDEEFLLRAVMPADQVDAMHTRAPDQLYYNPELSPVLKLLGELQKRPAVSHLKVQKQDFSLELRSGAAQSTN